MTPLNNKKIIMTYQINIEEITYTSIVPQTCDKIIVLVNSFEEEFENYEYANKLAEWYDDGYDVKFYVIDRRLSYTYNSFMYLLKLKDNMEETNEWIQDEAYAGSDDYRLRALTHNHMRISRL